MKGRALLPLAFMAVSCGNSKLPNVVYVFPDQMRGTALGFWSDPDFAPYAKGVGDPVRTPSLDAFAREACVLSSAFSNCPVSSPHRGSLLTGMYPNRSGIPINCRSDRPYSSLRPDLSCIGDVFKNAGYDCGYIGKYHADFPTPNDPQHPGQYSDSRTPAWDAYTPPEKRHGFDFWYSYGTFDEHKNPHYWDSEGNIHCPHEWSPTHEAGVAADFISGRRRGRSRRKPFFLMVSMNPPHSPYSSLEDCEEQDFNIYQGKSRSELLVRPNADTTMAKARCAAYYFASVTGVDRAFGRILRAIDDAGLKGNTIVIFASDHGETMCSQGTTDPKNSLYTESTNVPFIVRYPGRVRPRVDDLLLSTPDIMPTILGLAGLGSRIPADIQGRDLSSILLESEEAVSRPRNAVYIKNLDGEPGSDGLYRDYFPVCRGIKTPEWSFALTVGRDGTLKGSELFNDAEDPYQMVNIPLESQPETVALLCRQLGELLREIGDPWYSERILPEMIPYEP